MFDALSIRAQKPLGSEPLDLGAAVEGMLFYGRTKIFITSAGIKQMAAFWSPEDLLALLDSGAATFCYQQNIAAIRTQNTGSERERYEPVLVEIAQSRDVNAGPELLVGRVLEELTGKRGRARRLTAQVCRRLAVHRFDPDLPSRVVADLLDTHLVNRGVRRALQVYAPDLSLAPNTRFEVERVDDGLRVLTNIDFAAVNASYHQRVPPSHSSVTPALLLAHFLTAREMVEEAAASKVDIAADPIHSALASLRIEAVLASRSANEANVARFQDFLFDEGRAVREAVNGRRVSLPDILALIEKAQQFKGWLAGQPADADLAKEYFRAVTTSTWVDKLPSKTIRWLFFSAAGLGLDAVGAGGIGTAVGMGLGAVDSLFLDSILKGWKPNQFVEGSLKPFVKL